MRIKKRYILRTLLGLAGVALFLGLAFTMEQYYRLHVSNFRSRDGKQHGYYIQPGTSIDEALDMLEAHYDIGSRRDFELHARSMVFNYPEPGYYLIPERLGNRELITRLKFGQQDPISLTWTNAVRTREQLAGMLGNKLLLDSAEIISRLESNLYMAKFGLNKETSRLLFLPNTYNVYWTIKPDDLFNRMKYEYDQFWTEERLRKADKLNMTPIEVGILASIVESESNNKSELPTIASLYLNRLKKNMALQACPTVIYAVGDFSLRRILYRHLAVESPYNTYKHKGLPPGPIRCPLPRSIDFVLNAPKTNYLFMCANLALNGTHIFSANFNGHANAAAQYHNMMDSKKKSK